jgi:hypothetical protein
MAVIEFLWRASAALHVLWGRLCEHSRASAVNLRVIAAKAWNVCFWVRKRLKTSSCLCRCSLLFMLQSFKRQAVPQESLLYRQKRLVRKSLHITNTLCKVLTQLLCVKWMNEYYIYSSKWLASRIHFTSKIFVVFSNSIVLEFSKQVPLCWNFQKKRPKRKILHSYNTE